MNIIEAIVDPLVYIPMIRRSLRNPDGRVVVPMISKSVENKNMIEYWKDLEYPNEDGLLRQARKDRIDIDSIEIVFLNASTNKFLNTRIKIK